jgi:protein SCO1/2
MKTTHILALAILFAVLAGCSSTATTNPTAGQYEIKGKIVAVDMKKPAVTLDHEDIPGVMSAMKMEFKVEDAKLLDGLNPDDRVRGRLKKTPDGYLITSLEKR